MRSRLYYACSLTPGRSLTNHSPSITLVEIQTLNCRFVHAGHGLQTFLVYTKDSWSYYYWIFCFNKQVRPHINPYPFSTHFGLRAIYGLGEDWTRNRLVWLKEKYMCWKNKGTKNKPGIDRCKLLKSNEQNTMNKRQESLSSNRQLPWNFGCRFVLYRSQHATFFLTAVFLLTLSFLAARRVVFVVAWLFPLLGRRFFHSPLFAISFGRTNKRKRPWERLFFT